MERLFVGAGIAAAAFTARRTGVASAASRRFLLLFAGFADEGLARQADLVALDGENLDEDLVAKLQLVANVADAVLGDFADVQEAVGAREELDEGAKLREANDFAEIGFTDFGTGSDVADHRERGIAAGSAGGENVHGAVFENVDFDASSFDDRPDLLAARPDEVADFVLRDFQLEETRGVRGNRGARLAERFLHGVENLEAGFFRLREGFAHHPDGDAKDLDVHLQRGDTRASAGDFEVHIAVVVFGSGNVREDGVFLVVTNDEPHGDARAGSLQRDARVHEGERSAAHGGHGRGTIGFQNVGNEAHGVGKIRFRRKQVHKRALRQGAVADFAAARATQEFHFADAERREVVVQHEAVELVLLEEQVEALHVFLGAEGQSGQRLRFAAGKEGGTVDTGQQADFAGDQANLIEGAAVGTAAGVENIVAENIFAEAFQGALGEGALFVHLLLGLFGNRLNDLILESIDEVVAFLLGMLFGVQRVMQPVAVLFLKILVDGFIEGQRRDNDLLGLDLRVEFLDRRDDFFDLSVAELKGIRDSFFGNLERAGFHHDDGFIRAGNDDIHQTFLLVGDGRIDQQLPVDQANADASDGLLEREIRAVSRSRRAGYGNDIRVILAVRGEHHGDDLSFVAPRFREERAHGAVNQAGGENLFFRGAAFALEETAGDLSGGVGVLAVVNGERQEIAVIHRRGHASGGKHDRVAIARDNGAIGLFRNFSSFQSQSSTADFDRDAMWCGSVCIFRHESFPLAPRSSGASSGAFPRQTGLEFTLAALRPS